VVVAMLGIAAMRVWRRVEAGDFMREGRISAVAVKAAVGRGL